MTQNNRIMAMLTQEELERLYGGNSQGDDRSREEKISDYARTRERDGQGRFLSQRELAQAELESFYQTPYKIVYEPNPDRPHVLVRRERMYWYQKVYYWAAIGFAVLGSLSAVIGGWEGLKFLFK
jgi:hypothetical protein